jgi:hypothetical protein
MTVGAMVGALHGATEPGALVYNTVLRIAAPPLPAHGEKRAPFGWSAFPISHEHPTILTWSEGGAHPPAGQTSRLRLTVAVDERLECQVDVTLAKTGRPLGTFDLRFPQALQMFELVWNVTDATAAQREGVALRLRAKGPAIWCFSPSSEADASPREFQPHLLHTTGLVDAKAEYFRRLASLASIVPFGWMEGCVLDGLRDLAAGKPNSPFEKARREHWAMYLDHESRLAYAAASRPLLDQFETIEATLPIADLVLWRPRHRVVDLALGYLASAKKPATGLMYTQGTLSAEGAYTVAYPLAAIGVVRGDKTLSAEALRQLLGRLESPPHWRWRRAPARWVPKTWLPPNARFPL